MTFMRRKKRKTKERKHREETVQSKNNRYIIQNEIKCHKCE